MNVHTIGTLGAFNIHNRHRDWDGDGNHPGYTLAVWLRDFADQVWHFTDHLGVDWSSNAAERGVP